MTSPETLKRRRIARHIVAGAAAVASFVSVAGCEDGTVHAATTSASTSTRTPGAAPAPTSSAVQETREAVTTSPDMREITQGFSDDIMKLYAATSENQHISTDFTEGGGTLHQVGVQIAAPLADVVTSVTGIEGQGDYRAYVQYTGDNYAPENVQGLSISTSAVAADGTSAAVYQFSIAQNAGDAVSSWSVTYENGVIDPTSPSGHTLTMSSEDISATPYDDPTMIGFEAIVSQAHQALANATTGTPVEYFPDPSK